MSKKQLFFSPIVWHGLLTLALIFNIALLFSIKEYASKSEKKELEIVFLITPDCSHCFSLDPFAEYFKNNEIDEDKITRIEYNSFKGKRLIKKYGIAKVPTVLIEGDVMTDLEPLGEMRKNIFVITRVQPPYLDLETGQVKGEFELIYLNDESCQECYDSQLHETVLERLALKPTKTTKLDIGTEDGRVLVEQFAITAVPTIVMRGDLEAYESLQEIWPNVGTVEEDGTYVLRQGVKTMGVYKQLPEGVIINPDESSAS